MLAALLYMLACLCSAALALEVPSNAVFSPGLKRLAALEKTLPNVDAQAQVSIDKAMYARDLSLLQSMLDGAAIAYQRSSGGEAVTIHRGGEMLGAYAISQNAVLDALDSIDARRILASACAAEEIPYIYGAIAGWVAQAAVCMPGENLIEKLYPEDAAIKDNSVLSFTPALCAAMQGSLCVKLLVGKPVETGVLHYADLLYEEYTQIPMK